MPSEQEIKSKFPLTVSLSEYGDITYCETNNSMAIFYAQTDYPELTMEVIPIGKVTSDLSVFDTFDGSGDVTFTMAE